MRREIARALFFFAALGAPLWAQLDRPGPPNTTNMLTQNAGRVKAGEASFRQLCTGCHGRGGEGGQGEGQGPNLATNWEVRRAKDPELFGFIRNGVKGTAMPAFSLPEERIWELAAFVRSLNAPASSVPTGGDPVAGGLVFFAKGGCSACHMIRGRGGYLGPDLSNIGATRRLGELREALLKPSAAPSADFQPVLLHGPNGNRRAIAKHSSPWSLEVLDENGELHLLHGDAVHDVVFQQRSWMPSDIGQRLSPSEVENLLAFLSRQAIRSAEGVAN